MVQVSRRAGGHVYSQADHDDAVSMGGLVMLVAVVILASMLVVSVFACSNGQELSRPVAETEDIAVYCVTDDATGVEYLVSNKGGITPRLGALGSPVISE